MLRFTQQNRLVDSQDFNQIFKLGRKKYLKGVTVIALLNNQTIPRLGFTISKKQIKTAVNRNRIKRLAKEVFRQNTENLQGFDFVVLVNKTCLNFDNLTLKQSLHQLFTTVVNS